jgi:hypothetical protein
LRSPRTSRSPSHLNNTCLARRPPGIQSQEIAAALLSPHPGLAVGLAANTFVFAAGIQVLLKGLTWVGVLNSWLLGTMVYSAFGAGGYLLV